MALTEQNNGSQMSARPSLLMCSTFCVTYTLEEDRKQLLTTLCSFPQRNGYKNAEEEEKERNMNISCFAEADERYSQQTHR